MPWLVRTLLAFGLLAFAGPVSAHVTVHPSEAPHGAALVLHFRVPNERTTTDTVKLVVQFPQDYPIASVQPLPVAGWTARIAMRHLTTAIRVPGRIVANVVDTIAWRGGEIPPHSSLVFPVLAGPLPARGDVLVFKALQYYSNGETVRWIETPVSGEPAPPNPAPQLRLVGTASPTPR